MMRHAVAGILAVGLLGASQVVCAEPPTGGSRPQDRRGPVVDRQGDHRDRREDRWNAQRDGGPRDLVEDGEDAIGRKDVADRREGRRDSLKHHPKSAEELERLRKLKEEDPEAFRKAVQERRQQMRERLAHLKETDPQRYAEVMRRLKAHQRERLQHLKETDPEKFREVMEQRQARVKERLDDLKEHDPDRYADVMQRRREWRERKLDELKQRDPEAYARFLQDHPHWREERPDRGPDREATGPGEHLDRGVRDHGAGEGRGNVGQGGEHRSPRSQGAIRGGGRRDGR